MKKTIDRLLAGVVSSFLALTLCTVPAWAESPQTKITLAVHDSIFDPFTGHWPGTLTLTIDGVEYAGILDWWITDLTVVNKNSIHYFAAAICDFGELGAFVVWEHGNTDWGIVEPDYRLSPFSGVERIVGLRSLAFHRTNGLDALSFDGDDRQTR